MRDPHPQYPPGVTPAMIDALTETHAESAAAAAVRRAHKVKSALDALAAAAKECQQHHDDCPLFGLDWDDLPTPADMMGDVRIEEMAIEREAERMESARDMMWGDL